MSEDRHLFLDLDGLLQAVRAREKLHPVDSERRSTKEKLRLDAKWLTAFMSDQNAAVITKRVTFLDWDGDGVEDFVALGWQEKSKGKRKDHLSLNTLLRATLKDRGASKISPSKTLVLAMGDPTESVLKCVASYLEAEWAVELCCLQERWKILPKKATQRVRGYSKFENVFLDSFIDQLVRMPNETLWSHAVKKEPPAKLQAVTTDPVTTAFSVDVPPPVSSRSESSSEIVEAASAKLEESLSTQLEKHIQDAVAAFKHDMLTQLGARKQADKAHCSQQHSDPRPEETPWILPRQAIATPESNQEEDAWNSAPPDVRLDSTPESNTNEVLALKRQVQEMREALSALNVGISSQAALRRENEELQQRLDKQTQQITQINAGMSSQAALRRENEQLKQRVATQTLQITQLNAGMSSQAALRRENQELRQRLEKQTPQLTQMQAALDAARAERDDFEEQYYDAVERHREALLRREEILLCPVTQSLLETPMVTACCGNAFSRSSLLRVQACPMCRSPGPRVVHSRAMENVIAQFGEECAAFNEAQADA